MHGKAPACDALPEAAKRRLDGLVAEHSIFNSRARLGFSNFSDEERREMPPVPQVVVRTIPESGRKSLYLASQVRVVERPLKAAPPKRLRILLAPEGLDHLNPHLLPLSQIPFPANSNQYRFNNEFLSNQQL
jgi:Taurine catabolism dioxygenase TauD, TfdA family